jgi:hypothetical protein
MNDVRRLNWAVIVPVGLLAMALLAILWLDLATGGEAKPSPYLGTIGTPVRGTFVAPDGDARGRWTADAGRAADRPR